MSNKAKAKIRLRDKYVHKKNPRLYVMGKAVDGFGCFCITTHRLVASGTTEFDAKKRAGKRGWREQAGV